MHFRYSFVASWKNSRNRKGKDNSVSFLLLRLLIPYNPQRNIPRQPNLPSLPIFSKSVHAKSNNNFAPRAKNT